MKKTIVTLAILSVMVGAISSCKKKEDDPVVLPGRAATVVGTWKQTFAGNDDNNNGTWETSEKTAVPANTATIVFNNNYTGTSSQDFLGSQINGTTTWSMYNNDNGIRIISTVTGFGTDTFYYKIISLTASEAIVVDTTVTPYDYEQYSK